MTYDQWKATNPQDAELGSQPQPGQDDEPELLDDNCLPPKSALNDLGFEAL